MNFLLVLGTQKAGTTWLGSRLGRHPQYFAALKEWRALSKLNKIFLEKKGGFDERLQLPIKINKLNQADFMALGKQERRNYISASFHNYFSLAVSAFDWKKGADKNIKVVGDITGANGRWDESFLGHFKIAAESVGLRIKPVYIMRDPVSRHCSAVKMRFLNKVLGKEVVLQDRFSIEKYAEKLNRYCLSRLGVPEYDEQAAYQDIVPKIERVFGSQEILFCFSENMREPGSINQFTDFLEMDRLECGHEKIIDASGSNIGLLEYEFPDEVKSEIYRHYSRAYSFTKQRFKEDVPGNWAFIGN